MVARAACKVAFGMDLPVSDFLGAFEGELVGEFGADLAEQFIGLVDLEGTISAAAAGTAGQGAHGLVGDSLKNLKSFIKKQRADSEGSLFVEHTDQMRLCDDAEGGRVWVSLRNVAKWSNRLEKRDPTAPSIQGDGVPFGTQGGTKLPLQTPSTIPGSSDSHRLLGGEKFKDPCAVEHQVDKGGGVIVNCKDPPAGTIEVRDSLVKPSPSASGGCCVVS